MAFRFEGLEVFQLAVAVAQIVYRLTEKFPKSEMFGLASNVRRAATSIAANIAEGSGRGTRREFIRFIDIASGSVFETVACMILAQRFGYVTDSDLDEVREAADHLGRKLQNFKKSLDGRR